MADESQNVKPEEVDTALGDMKLEEGNSQNGAGDTIAVNGKSKHASTYGRRKTSQSSTPAATESRSQSPTRQSTSATPKSEAEEAVIGGDITVTVEPGKMPKLSRKHSQKVISRPPPLFDDLPDVTEEAASVFQRIKDCIYGSKYMGSSEHDALDCDCSEEWSKSSTSPPSWCTDISRGWKEPRLW